MKHSKLIIILLLAFIGCRNNEEPINFKKGSVIINGRIDNPTVKTISVISLDVLSGRKQNTFRLNHDGSFFFTVETVGAHDNYLRYNNDLVTFFAEPNDSLYLTAEGGNFEKTLKFSGDKAEFNKTLSMFFDEFGNNINELFKNKSDASPSEFKAFITAFNNDRYKAIESIENEIKPEKEAINWMKSYLNYRRAEELFEFGRKYKGDLPSDYYSFVSDYENPAPDDLKCSQYYEDFVSEYYFGYQFGQLDEYKKARNMFSNGKTYEGMNLIFDIINSNVSNQIAKELLLTKVCTDNVRYDYEAVYSIYNNRYLPLVKTSDFQLLVKQKIEEKAIASRKTRTIQDLMELEFIGEVFSEVNENHNGKVLYIDMWGTWCKGCIMQFPFSNELHDSLKSEAIEFVYLCCKSNEEDWEKSKEKYGLRGTHYLLTDNQYSVFSGELDIAGIPRYMIINKKGVIVDEKAKSPNNERIKSELVALVNE